MTGIALLLLQNGACSVHCPADAASSGSQTPQAEAPDKVDLFYKLSRMQKRQASFLRKQGSIGRQLSAACTPVAGQEAAEPGSATAAIPGAPQLPAGAAADAIPRRHSAAAGRRSCLPLRGLIFKPSAAQRPRHHLHLCRSSLSPVSVIYIIMVSVNKMTAMGPPKVAHHGLTM